jgi:hypothetical protein
MDFYKSTEVVTRLKIDFVFFAFSIADKDPRNNNQVPQCLLYESSNKNSRSEVEIL